MRSFTNLMLSYRGGGELGKEWYEEGKLQKKMNSFKDFISVAEHLIDSKLTSPDHLTAMGTSAGGLLVGKQQHFLYYLTMTLIHQ